MLIIHETLLKQIVFLIEKPGFNGFLKIIGARIQLPISFCSDLMRNKTLKARNSTYTHTNFQPLISVLHVESKQKVIRK